VLGDLAIDNFIEMRDKTASKTFRAKKKLDHLLEGLLPGVYLPLCTMGHIHPHPLRRSRPSRASPGPHRPGQPHRYLDDRDRGIVDPVAF
jgi:hypothetical protein